MFKILGILGLLVLVYLVLKNFIKKNTRTPPLAPRDRKVIPFKKTTSPQPETEKEIEGIVVEIDKNKAEAPHQKETKNNKVIPFRAENLIFPTERGEMVRSKSEAHIANTLFKLGIEYHYEYKFQGKNGDYKLPDFLFFTTEREVIIWEHLGMLDDKNYYHHWKQKEAWYLEEGFKLGETLFTTEHYIDNPEKGYRTIEKMASLIKKRLTEGRAVS